MHNFQPEIPERPVSQTNHKAKHKKMEVQLLRFPPRLPIFFLSVLQSWTIFLQMKASFHSSSTLALCNMVVLFFIFALFSHNP